MEYTSFNVKNDWKAALPFLRLKQDVIGLEQGGVYWVLAPRSADAQLLAVQTVAQTMQQHKVVLVGSHNQLKSLVPSLDTLSKKSLRILQIKAKAVDFLRQLPKQLERAVNPKKKLIVLVLQEHSAAFWQYLQNSSLKAWRNWTEENKCTLLVIASGEYADALQPSILQAHAFLAGAATLEVDPSDQTASRLFYDVAYWRTPLGVQTGCRYKLHYKDQSFVYKNTHTADLAQSEPVNRTTWSKSPLIFQQVVVGEAASFLSEQGSVVQTWQDLVELALHTPEATVVFGLGIADSLEQLARLIYDLRLQRGAALKIIVCELNKVLRTPEEELLIQCGVTKVIPAANLARVLHQVEEISTQPTTYTLTTDLEQAISLVHPIPDFGAIAPKKFASYLQDLMPYWRKAAALGTLVVLQPRAPVTAAQLLSQVHLTRQGDITCATEKNVYIFLLGCLPDLVEMVLHRVLALPYKDVVIQTQIVTDPYGVETQIRHLQQYEPSLESKISSEPMSPQSAPTAASMRFTPKQVALDMFTPSGF